MLAVRKTKGKTEGVRGSRGRPDPWQKAVYGFEDDWPEACADSLTLRQCGELIKLACAAYGFKAPPVRLDKTAKLSYCYADGSGLYLIKTQLNKFVALHEATHYIADKIYGQEPEDHGFEFQGVYFYLLSCAELAPVVALQASAKERGLIWRTTPPPCLTKTQKARPRKRPKLAEWRRNAQKTPSDIGP